VVFVLNSEFDDDNCMNFGNTTYFYHWIPSGLICLYGSPSYTKFSRESFFTSLKI
jgi:hypothetical protein